MFCTRRIAKSASPSRDFASTVVSELRKHTPEKGSADTCIPSAWAASALRRSAHKVGNHNLYSAMWQELCAAASQERKRAQVSSECRGCTSLSSGCSPLGGRTSRTSPSTASTSPRAVVSLPCRNCVLALHSCRPSTCTGFACQAYLSEHVSHAADERRSKKCIWLVSSPLCVFSTGSAGRRRMPRLANVCDTPRTLLWLPNNYCISLVCLYCCSSSTYSGVLDQKRKEVVLGRS